MLLTCCRACLAVSSLDPPEMSTNQLLLVSTLGLGVNLFGMFAMGGHHHHHHVRMLILELIDVMTYSLLARVGTHILMEHRLINPVPTLWTTTITRTRQIIIPTPTPILILITHMITTTLIPMFTHLMCLLYTTITLLPPCTPINVIQVA